MTAGHRFAEVIAPAGRSRAAASVGLRDRRALPRDPLRAGGHGDRRPPPGHHLDHATARSSTSSSCPAGSTSTRAATRCGWRSTTRRRAGGWWAPCRGHLLPQALHRLRRRQVGDQQEPGGRGAAGLVLRADFDEDMALVAGRSSARTTSDARVAGERGSERPHPLARALARLGDQAAHAEPDGLHARVQRLAGEHPQPHPGAGLHHQALLPAGVGRRLARHFSVDIINGAPGHELKYEGRKLVASYLRVGRDGHGAWRTYKLRQDFVAADKVQMEDDITASVVVPAAGWSACPASTTGTRASSWRRTASSGCSSGPTTRSTRARPADRGGHGAAGLFCSNFQPLDASDVQRHRRGRRGPRRVHPADAGARRPERRRAPMTGTRSARREPAARRRQADQEPALPPAPPRPRAPARPLRRRDGRAAEPPAAAAASRCSSR